jgi:hypothetical protein
MSDLYNTDPDAWRAKFEASAQRIERRREIDRREARRWNRLLVAEREKSLPADVPLHKRGFGVMDEDAP